MSLILFKVAKKYNLNTGKIVEILAANGREIANKPNAKLSDDDLSIIEKQIESVKEKKYIQDKIESKIEHDSKTGEAVLQSKKSITLGELASILKKPTLDVVKLFKNMSIYFENKPNILIKNSEVELFMRTYKVKNKSLKLLTGLTEVNLNKSSSKTIKPHITKTCTICGKSIQSKDYEKHITKHNRNENTAPKSKIDSKSKKSIKTKISNGLKNKKSDRSFSEIKNPGPATRYKEQNEYSKFGGIFKFYRLHTLEWNKITFYRNRLNYGPINYPLPGAISDWNTKKGLMEALLPYGLTSFLNDKGKFFSIIELEIIYGVAFDILQNNTESTTTFTNVSSNNVEEQLKKYKSSFKFKYLQYLLQKQNELLTIVQIIERIDHQVGQFNTRKTYLFTIIGNKEWYIILESLDDNTATYIFKIKKDSMQDYYTTKAYLKYYFESKLVNKRELLSTKKIQEHITNFPSYIIFNHGDFDRWVRNLEKL
jgi:hypothetical protein